MAPVFRIGLACIAVAVGAATGVCAAELPPAGLPTPEAIDRLVEAPLAAAKIVPAPVVDDAAFLRRVTLDLVGRIPARVEWQEFVADPDPAKREKLVDRLMASPEYVEFQAIRLGEFLTPGESSLRGYLVKALGENRGWDRIFRDVLAGRPDDEVEKEAQAFLKSRARDLDLLTNDASVAFFGVNVSCARCHDHPLVEDWKQDHFYGMKSFFSATFDVSGTIGERDWAKVEYETTKGEKRAAKLMFLTGTEVAVPEMKEPSSDERKKEEERLKELAKNKQPFPVPNFSRRAKLVEEALRPTEQHFFSRAIVNRLWLQFTGHGFVMPPDQMHAANPPSHPELLNWLARDLVEHGYDLRRLVRGIVLSKTYARGTRWDGKGERPAPEKFAAGTVRPLVPFQLARSLSLATADQKPLDGQSDTPDRMAAVAKTAALRDDKLFEQPGEGFQVSAQEALLFSNGSQIPKGYLAGGLVKTLDGIAEDDALFDLAVATILTRTPTPEERRWLQDYLARRADRRPDAVRQIVWSLIASAEFRFNY